MIDLTKNERPFGLMSEEGQRALEDAERDGEKIESFVLDGWREKKAKRGTFEFYLAYRVAPQPIIMPTFPFDAVDDRFICGAVNSSGHAYMHENPAEIYSIYSWSSHGPCMRVDGVLKGYSRGNVPWDQSLVWRTGHEPEVK